jgi:hemoglobin
MSLYTDLGGEASIDAAVDLFYQKVLADQRINTFFDGVDMDRQKSMQRKFLTYAFGGPNNYNGNGMRKAHERAAASGLNDAHFDAVMENLGATLQELGVPADKISEAAAIAESTREDVLNRSQQATGTG